MYEKVTLSLAWTNTLAYCRLCALRTRCLVVYRYMLSRFKLTAAKHVMK